MLTITVVSFSVPLPVPSLWSEMLTEIPTDTKVGIQDKVRVPYILRPISRSSQVISRSNGGEQPMMTKPKSWAKVRVAKRLVIIEVPLLSQLMFHHKLVTKIGVVIRYYDLG